MGISDKIEAFILELMKQEQEALKIQRNELAEVFGCVPSQINYVISTRFRPEHGYIVTSRRGGGGCVIIQKIGNDDIIPDEVSEREAYLCVKGLYDGGQLSLREAEIIQAAVSDTALFRASGRDKVRADILKNILRKIKEEV